MAGFGRVLSLAVVVILVGGGCGSSPSGDVTGQSRPLFQVHACPFSVTGGAFKGAIRCGYVLVPEERSARGSPTVRLAVAIFKAPGPHPAPDPLVYLIGGPGGYVVGPMGSSIVRMGLPDYVGNRDLILVDQRGTGLSQPAPTCPELYAARDEALTEHLSNVPKSDLLVKALRACRVRLAREGVDLTAFNTAESAADISDLRTALGYKQIDLYGGSYGSDLVQQVMLDHPPGIRSVVMDAVVIPRFKLVDEIPNLWHSLRLLFKTCAADKAVCSILYPHLQQSLVKAVRRLQSHPPTIHVLFPDVNRTYEVTLDSVELLATLRSALMDPWYVPLLPKLISEMSKGDYQTARLLENDLGFANDIFTPYVAMSLSMSCTSNVVRFSKTQVVKAALVFPPVLRAAAGAQADTMLRACAVWKVPFVPAANHPYFRSRIPSLLLPGAFDPNNSPAQEAALAGHLTHSRVVSFPTLSHVVVGTGSCPDDIMQAFLDNPQRKPDTRCVHHLFIAWQ